MKVLGTSRKCLSYVGLGNERYIPVAGIRVPRELIRCLYTSAEVSGIIMFAMIAIINLPFGLQAVLFPLHLISLSCMKTSMYTVLMAKAARMAELGDYLQMVVDERECFSYRILHGIFPFFFAVVRIFHRQYRLSTDSNWFFIFLGCQLSSRSTAIYAEQKANESKIVKIIWFILPGLVLFAYSPSMLTFLSSIIFGAPSADYWAIPLSTDLM